MSLTPQRRSFRIAIVALLLAISASLGCRSGGAGRSGAPEMPAEVAAKHDPTVDTSKNPELSHSTAHFRDPSADRWGCFGPFLPLRCAVDPQHGGHGNPAGVVLLALAATPLLRRRSRPRR